MTRGWIAACSVLSFVLSLGSAAACQIDFLDEFGNPTGPPSLDENIAASQKAFIGTVRGFRSYSGEVIEKDIECWRDPSYSDEACDALTSSVMTAILSVDHAIKGIEAGRFYEELYDTGDGDCGPWFSYGKRYMYNTRIFGVEELGQGCRGRRREKCQRDDRVLEHG